MGVSGCQTTRWKQSRLYRRSPVAIYLEREEREGQTVHQGFAHPAQVPPVEVRALLASLYYRSGGWFTGPTQKPVFEPREVEALADPLSEALFRAGPDQRVRFLVGRTTWRPVLGPKGVSGVVFLRTPEGIELAFDILDESLPDETGDPDAMVFRRDPLTITGSQPEVESRLGSVRTGAPGGKIYPRWLVVERRQLAAAAAPAKPAEPAGPPPAAPSPSGKPPAAEGSSQLDQETEAIRRKLQVLDELKRQGTISQEEYEKARRQILVQSER